MGESDTVANNPCGANILCADTQVFFAYSLGMTKGDKQPDDAAKAIADRIRAAMQRLGLNNSQLGDLWGGHRQTVQQWLKEKPHSPKGADLPRLCALLAIDANELLDIDPSTSLKGTELERHRKRLHEQVEAVRAAKRQSTQKISKKSVR